jgi:hypothetical protein
MARYEATVGPGSVAVLSAFDGSETRRECAKQEIRGHPKRHPRSATARTIRGGLGFRHHIIHAFFGVGLMVCANRSRNQKFPRRYARDGASHLKRQSGLKGGRDAGTAARRTD